MEVFVLNYLCEYTDYPCEMYCEGVFKTFENAREEMEKLFEKKKQEWLNNYCEEEDMECTDNGCIMKLFNTMNNIDYVRYEIFVMNVE